MTASPRLRRLPVHRDGRGTLLPVELDAGTVGFEVRRVFVVSGPDEGASRGGHEADCRELIVLVSGRVRVLVGQEAFVLDQPGDAVALEQYEPMSYELGAGGATILVLADQPWGGRGSR